MLAGNYGPEWPEIMARTGRVLWPCWPDKMTICKRHGCDRNRVPTLQKGL